MEEKTREQRHEEYLSKIPEFTLMDDTFMNACFNEQTELVQKILRIIMNKPELKVINSQVQKVFKNLHGHSVTLDIHAVDIDRTRMDVEIQRDDRGANPERARFISSILDANILDPGDNFDELPETYVIFITENDVLKMGQPIYIIERRIGDTNVLFNDKSHIIYVNSSIQDDTPLGRLMHDFHCKNAADMYDRDIAERVSQLKSTEGGKQYMCKIMEELIVDRNIEFAIDLLKLNKLSIEEISKTAKLPIEEVKKLSETLKPQTA